MQALGGEAWIDFVADTGDDVTVSERRRASSSRRVRGARSRRSELDAALPRGHVLILGGDFAYPVATVREMTRRLVDPGTASFERTRDGSPRPPRRPRQSRLVRRPRWLRAPLPGAVRRSRTAASVERRSPSRRRTSIPCSRGRRHSRAAIGAQAGRARARGLRARPARELLPIAARAGARPLRRRPSAPRRRPAAAGVLRSDARARARIVVLPDPARAWGELRPNGAATLAALGIDPRARPMLRPRRRHPPLRAVRRGPERARGCGGGGAFLHGARIAGGGSSVATRSFPGRVRRRRCSATAVARGDGGRRVGHHRLFALGDAVALASISASASNEARRRDHAEPHRRVGTALLVGWRRRIARNAWLPFALASVWRRRVARRARRRAPSDGASWPRLATSSARVASVAGSRRPGSAASLRRRCSLHRAAAASTTRSRTPRSGSRATSTSSACASAEPETARRRSTPSSSASSIRSAGARRCSSTRFAGRHDAPRCFTARASRVIGASSRATARRGRRRPACRRARAPRPGHGSYVVDAPADGTLVVSRRGDLRQRAHRRARDRRERRRRS